MHEVGHTVLLKHTRANSPAEEKKELMFYTGLIGPQTPIDRRIIDPAAGNGGFDVVSKSNLITELKNCNTPDVGTLLLPPAKSCVVSGFTRRFIKTGDLTIYPNPAENYFTVEFETGDNANIQFSIYDFTGKEIIRMESKQLPKGMHQEQVNTEQLKVGLYLIVANINGQIKTKKIIKM